MKVLLLSHGFQAEYEAGIANGLAANGVEVTLVACDGTLFERLDPRIETLNLRGSQDPRRSRAAKALNVLAYMLRFLWLVAQRRHDVVHNIGLFATGNASISLLEAALVKLLSRRQVHTVHNVLPHERDTPRNRAIHRWLYALPDRLVTHTERARQRLEGEFGVAPGRVLVMEHGIDRFPPFDADARRRLRAELGVPDASPLALFFGQLGWYKGPDLLIDAMGRLPEVDAWQLLIAGRCTHAEVRRGVGERIARSPARARIHWWERYIADAEVPALFFAADVLVLPYRHIDQSGVLFMALATGLPVVAADVGSLRHYVEQHAGHVVPPEDVPALVRGLQSPGLVKTTPERMRLAAQAWRFDWRVTVRPILSSYGPPGAATLTNETPR